MVCECAAKSLRRASAQVMTPDAKRSGADGQPQARWMWFQPLISLRCPDTAVL